MSRLRLVVGQVLVAGVAADQVSDVMRPYSPSAYPGVVRATWAMHVLHELVRSWLAMFM